MTTVTQTPVYLYASKYKNGGVPAVGECCAQKTEAMLEACLGKGKFVTVTDSSKLAQIFKTERSGVVQIPAGHLFPLQADIGPLADLVKGFVSRGGSIFGSGSGGMILCDRLRLRSAKDEVVTQDSLFRLVPVEVTHPVTGLPTLGKPNVFGGENGREIVVMDRELGSYSAYHNEGGALRFLDADAGMQAECYYLGKDLPLEIAAASGPCGDGRVAIVQPLLEFDPKEALKPRDKDDTKEASKEADKDDRKGTGSSKEASSKDSDGATRQKVFYRMLKYTMKA